MDYLAFLPLIISFLWACVYVLFFGLGSKNPEFPKLPPGPPSYPIIGNILELGTTRLHQALNNLSKTYGPIITVKIGTIKTIVISSPSIAKEALQQKDQAFASRFVPQAVQALEHHKASVAFLPVSPQWRTLRKFCATKIFSSELLDSTQALRGKKLQELINYVQESCRKGEAIDIGEAAFITILNTISSTLFSIDLAGYSSDSSQQFRNVISSAFLEASKPNIADYLPFLRLFDPQGAKRRMRKYYQKLLAVFDCIIEKRMQKVDSMAENDVLESFLSLNLIENYELTRHDFLHLVLDLFIAGVDTTSSTIEWVMAELLHNPEKIMKARKELQQVLGKDEELKDSDISKLPYLQAIVKETIRLHPAVPILVHKSESEVDLCGFKIPKDALVLVNVWAMGRNPSIWANPDKFLPERFLEVEREFKGNDFGFIPFGAGRRTCPGVALAYRIAHTMVAFLLQHFDWKLEDGQKPENMDMREAYGITLHKVQGLRVMATPIKEQ